MGTPYQVSLVFYRKCYGTARNCKKISQEIPSGFYAEKTEYPAACGGVLQLGRVVDCNRPEVKLQAPSVQ